MNASNYFDSERVLNTSGILVVILIGSLVIYTESDSSLLPLVIFLATGILLGFVGFLRAQQDLHRHRLFWMMALFITVLFFVAELDIVAVLTLVWIVIAAELYGPRRAAMLAVASMTTFLLSQIYHSGIENLLDSVISVALYSLLQLFALSVVLRGIRERRLREETALLNRELLATRELLSQSSAQAERVRIARDLHDLLGHHMTALILNLEVAKHSIPQAVAADAGDSDGDRAQHVEGKAQEKVEQALSLAKLLLGDIRTAVSELREEDAIDLLVSIEKLTEGIPDIRFQIDFSTAPQFRSVQLAETLLRCVQEGITNIIRHSGASRCQITIGESRGRCVLTVKDDGRRNLEVTPGNGIVGMQERVMARGGSLSYEQTREGFTLRIELPLDEFDED